MIARTWRCMATSEKVADYVSHFERNVFPELRALTGFSEAFILRRPLNDAVEITVMTLWESMDAIRSFAGDQVERAVVTADAEAVLISYDPTVIHSDVILNSK